MHLLVTRPEPAASATAARLHVAGHTTTLAPLLGLEPVAWTPPATPPTALMLTSAAAARLANPPAEWHDIPVFTVGTATRAAAEATGFTRLHPPAATVQTLIDSAAAAGITHLHHLAGTDRTPIRLPQTLEITTIITYTAPLLPLHAPPKADWILLYSPRTAAHFAAECDRLGHSRAKIAIAGLSANTIAAAGPGWRTTATALTPDEDALFAAIGILCQTARNDR